MNMKEKSKKDIIKIIKRLNFFTLDELQCEITLDKSIYYSDELLDYILLQHPNIKHTVGFFYWDD